MKRKIAVIGALLLACVLLLTSCLPPPPENPATPDTTDDTPAPTTSESASPPPAPAPPEEPAPPAVNDAAPSSANASSANSTAATPVDVESLVVPRISIEELKSKIDAGENVLVVDSRSLTAYDSMHISGAISMPLFEMAAPYPDLVGYDEIILYCT